jgi:microcystin-dependent protein
MSGYSNIRTTPPNFRSNYDNPSPFVPNDYSVNNWVFNKSVVDNLYVQHDIQAVGLPTGTSLHAITIDEVTKYIQVHYNALTPPGTIHQYAALTAPAGYLLCDGSAVSRVQYARLFEIIGTVYGSGDGVNTFNLPNLVGRVAVGYQAESSDFGTLGQSGGQTTHTLTTDEIPAHAHTGNTDSAGAHTHNYQDAYFAENRGGGPNNVFGTNAATDSDNSFIYRTAAGGYSNTPSDIATSSNGAHIHSFTSNNTGGGLAHNNLQPYVVTQYIIKY